MGKRGKMVYVPKSVIAEINEIMAKDKIKIKSKAFDKLIEYSVVGREFDNLYNWRLHRLSIFKKKR